MQELANTCSEEVTIVSDKPVLHTLKDSFYRTLSLYDMAFYVRHPKRQVVNKILLSPQQDSPSAPVMVFTQPLHPNLNHSYICNTINMLKCFHLLHVRK